MQYSFQKKSLKLSKFVKTLETIPAGSISPATKTTLVNKLNELLQSTPSRSATHKVFNILLNELTTRSLFHRLLSSIINYVKALWSNSFYVTRSRALLASVQEGYCNVPITPDLLAVIGLIGSYYMGSSALIRYFCVTRTLAFISYTFNTNTNLIVIPKSFSTLLQSTPLHAVDLRPITRHVPSCQWFIALSMQAGLGLITRECAVYVLCFILGSTFETLGDKLVATLLTYEQADQFQRTYPKTADFLRKMMKDVCYGAGTYAGVALAQGHFFQSQKADNNQQSEDKHQRKEQQHQERKESTSKQKNQETRDKNNTQHHQRKRQSNTTGNQNSKDHSGSNKKYSSRRHHSEYTKRESKLSKREMDMLMNNHECRSSPTMCDYVAKRVLGIRGKKKLTTKALKKAYRSKSKFWHPDKCPDSAKKICEGQMYLINSACGILKKSA